MSSTVLLAYDGSAAADAAVTTAGRLIRGATGRLLTVVELPPVVAGAYGVGPGLDLQAVQEGVDAVSDEMMKAGAETAARGVAAARGAGLTLEPVTAQGLDTTWQSILSSADEIDADAIVCGSRGRGDIARSLLGSTSTSVLHHATRPVLVVPAEAAAREGPALIAYDGSPGARAAVAVAGRLLPGRRALIVHVWYSAIRHTLAGRALAHGPLRDLRSFADDYERVFAEHAASVVEEGATLAREADLDASGRAVESHAGAWRALAETAAGEDAAVIVCGSRGRGAVAATVLGSVSSGLVHNADSPALIVRPESGPPA